MSDEKEVWWKWDGRHFHLVSTTEDALYAQCGWSEVKGEASDYYNMRNWSTEPAQSKRCRKCNANATTMQSAAQVAESIF